MISFVSEMSVSVLSIFFNQNEMKYSISNRFVVIMIK